MSHLVPVHFVSSRKLKSFLITSLVTEVEWNMKKMYELFKIEEHHVGLKYKKVN